MLLWWDLQHLCLIAEGSEYHIQPGQWDLVLFQSHMTLALPVLCICFSQSFCFHGGQATWHRQDPPSQEEVGTTLPLTHLLVRFLTGHKTLLFPSQGKSGTYWSLGSGNIKDWNHQKCFFLISWSFTSKHLLLLMGMLKASPSNTFYCRKSFCQVLEGT